MVFFYKRRLLFTINRVKQKNFYKQTHLNLEMNLFFQTTYALFIMSALYTNTFLPYGRFYNRSNFLKKLKVTPTFKHFNQIIIKK